MNIKEILDRILNAFVDFTVFVGRLALIPLEKSIKFIQNFEVPQVSLPKVPKIDIKIKDSLKRLWQCSTIQVDFNIPEKFKLDFVNSNGKKEQPVMIHRALFGSLERFFGILIEHYGGRFPLWLAPVQVEIIPISEKHYDYSFELKKKLESQGIRVELNNKDEKLGKKIWGSRNMQIPYSLVIGDKELESNVISIRSLSKGDMGQYTIDDFIGLLSEECDRKS